MEFHERMVLGPILWAKLHDLTGTAFETFFHNLMGLCIPGFVPVRTHGNIGDLGSDGLSLNDGKLYACYAPDVANATATINKFRSDLDKAATKRPGQFSTFVFAHNDVRGVHPELSVSLAEARKDYPAIEIEVMGFPRFRDLLKRCDRIDVEDLLGTRLPLQHETTVGLQEMEKLLGFLSSKRLISENFSPIATVSSRKLAYSALSDETQAEMRDAMKYSQIIDAYYQSRIDVTERDEVATRFHVEYSELQYSVSDPEETLYQLRMFLCGSKLTRPAEYRAASAILAYFFQTCDIFEDDPSYVDSDLSRAI